MDFAACRKQFDDYVADTLSVGVYLQGSGVMVPASVQAGQDVDVRVVVANHPSGQPDTTSMENPPSGTNLNDVRFHLKISSEQHAKFVVPATFDGAYYRSGWEVIDSILTPGEVYAEVFVHLNPDHPSFALTTDDVLDEFAITVRTSSPGDFTVKAEARVTPLWRTVSDQAVSATVTIIPGA